MTKIKKVVEAPVIEKEEVIEAPVVKTNERLDFLYKLLDLMKSEGVTRISDVENKINQEILNNK